MKGNSAHCINEASLIFMNLKDKQKISRLKMSRKFKITPSETRNLLVPDTARMIERYVNREIDRIYDLAAEIIR